MYVVTQLFGITAVAMSLIIYSRKTRIKILAFKLVQDVCWFVHYLLLGTYPAAATSFLCISRSVVYANNHRKFFASKIWLLVYVLLYAASAVLTWKSVFSIFPAVSSILSAIGFWLKTPRRTKTVSIFASLCSLVYNITTAHSPAVYIGVTFTITTSLYSIVRESMETKRRQAEIEA